MNGIHGSKITAQLQFFFSFDMCATTVEQRSCRKTLFAYNYGIAFQFELGCCVVRDSFIALSLGSGSSTVLSVNCHESLVQCSYFATDKKIILTQHSKSWRRAGST